MGNPIVHTAKMPDNGRLRRPIPLAFEKSRLGGAPVSKIGELPAALDNPGDEAVDFRRLIKVSSDLTFVRNF